MLNERGPRYYHVLIAKDTLGGNRRNPAYKKKTAPQHQTVTQHRAAPKVVTTVAPRNIQLSFKRPQANLLQTSSADSL